MATIDIKIDDELLIASVTGDLTVSEVVAVINEHYTSGIIKDVIWDLTNGSMQSISTEGLLAISKASKEASANGLRNNGRTAFVARDTAEHNMFCKYTAIAEIAGVAVDYNVFKTLNGALNWIHGRFVVRD